MGDDHRRIEPRNRIPGTGMLSDPDRIEKVTSQAARFERATAPRAKRKFGDVLDKDRERREQEEETEEEIAAREAAAVKAEAERLSIRKLMGRSAVHPSHGGRLGKVTIKG